MTKNLLYWFRVPSLLERNRENMADLDLDQLYFAIVDGNAKAAAGITFEEIVIA